MMSYEGVINLMFLFKPILIRINIEYRYNGDRYTES